MPKILITGNGFDLSYGLPTGYSDFIKICQKLKDTKEFKWKNLVEDIEVLKNAETLPKSSFKNFDAFKEKLIKNRWFRYLTREYGIYTWIDFEKQIEKALVAIQENLDNIKNETFSKHGRISNLDEIYYDEELIKKKYEIFLTLIDFEILLEGNRYETILNKILLRSVNDYYVDFEKEKVFSKVLTDLTTLKEIFEDYLDNIVIPLYDLIKNDEKSIMLKGITHHFTFNYTPTFNNVVLPNSSTVFIHGELEKKNIVLGINESGSQHKDDSYLIPFTKYFQKLKLDINLKFIDEIYSEDELYQFFVWGHSLDKSDSIYINEIFDKLDSLTNDMADGKIIIIYHSEFSKSNIIKNLIEIRGSKDIIKKSRDEKLLFLHHDSPDLKSELSLYIGNKYPHMDIFSS
ncbi:AbiH family protein [Sphingobacterium hungaricum]